MSSADYIPVSSSNNHLEIKTITVVDISSEVQSQCIMVADDTVITEIHIINNSLMNEKLTLMAKLSKAMARVKIDWEMLKANVPLILTSDNEQMVTDLD
jgi:hypothetical protein